MADTDTKVGKKTKELVVYDELVSKLDPFTDRALAFKLATETRRHDMVQRAMYQVASQTWGKALPNEMQQKALCEWALSRGIEFRHINILGGTVYLTADYYIERLVVLPDYKHSSKVIVAPYSFRRISTKIFDEKTQAKLLTKQIKLNAMRHELQDEWEVPEEINLHPKTSAAVLVRIEMKDGSIFQEVRKAGSYGRKSPKNPSKGVDPVGDSAPIETATTRAYRACCKIVPAFKAMTEETDGELANVNELIEHARQDRKAREAEVDARHHLIEQVREMLDDPHVDPMVSDNCRIIYEDWIAGAFQNVTIEQIQQLANELQGSKQEIKQEGICLMCNASIDMGEPHGEDCPTRLSVTEDVVDGKTGEVIEEDGNCAFCGVQVGMDEPHNRNCPRVEDQ